MESVIATVKGVEVSISQFVWPILKISLADVHNSRNQHYLVDCCPLLWSCVDICRCDGHKRQVINQQDGGWLEVLVEKRQLYAGIVVEHTHPVFNGCTELYHRHTWYFCNKPPCFFSARLLWTRMRIPPHRKWYESKWHVDSVYVSIIYKELQGIDWMEGDQSFTECTISQCSMD